MDEDALASVSGAASYALYISLINILSQGLWISIARKSVLGDPSTHSISTGIANDSLVMDLSKRNFSHITFNENQLPSVTSWR